MLSFKCLVLFLIAEVSAEICASMGRHTFCNSGTYCCHNNTQCCSDLDTWRIVGIVIGIVVNITGCVVICVCCYRRRASPGQVLQPNAGTQMVISSVNQQNTSVAAPRYPAQYPAQYPYPAYPKGQQQPSTQYPAAYPPLAHSYGQPSTDQAVPPALSAKMR
ncbi:cysteine and tyrosine-rich protein 1-like [Dreissena polymorpha]|uniref:cysteine and tyrosine-rich protein 1-like n=1 Tax=Dreissena polymorpha TaxID=45954 RepID=UPI002264F037|nr:cysteine and tyrosine-rich protein 1-like [Dreissena polymorpha]